MLDNDPSPFLAHLRDLCGSHPATAKWVIVPSPHEFYEKHGGKTIVLARFIPIIRTFAPFVAGIGRMTYWHFIVYNVVGGVVWVGLFVAGGYFFGNIPAVKEGFTLVILAIIVISVLPLVFEILRARLQASRATSSG